ncbi:MAG: SRPBCC family protein [Gammaproteobacteria bacterium]
MHKFLKCSAAALLAVPVAVMAHGPSRQKVEKEVEINAPAEAVWKAIRGVCSIKDWHPAVAACESKGEGKGATRVLTLGSPDSGKVINEEYTMYDDDKMTFKYKITEVKADVLPVNSYAAVMTITPVTDAKTKVEWKAGFYRFYTQNDPPAGQDEKAANDAVNGVFDTGLAGLKKFVETGSKQ